MRAQLIAVILLGASGCMATQLKAPVQSHKLQTEEVAKRCERGDYGPCSDALLEELDTTARAAAAIDAIVKGQPAPNGGEGK